MMPMFKPHTATSFRDSPILDAVDDEVAKARGLIGEMEQLLHKLNVQPSSRSFALS
jgi:hypothetical protein